MIPTLKERTKFPLFEHKGNLGEHQRTSRGDRKGRPFLRHRLFFVVLYVSIESMSDAQRLRPRLPGACAASPCKQWSMLCRKCASRIFYTTYEIRRARRREQASGMASRQALRKGGSQPKDAREEYNSDGK